MIISQEKECTVVVKNSQTKDGGIWKFLIGTMHGTNYREVEQDNNVVISNEGKLGKILVSLMLCKLT